ncbi:MAG TPA: hypothetical protein PKC45_17915 [Gemmatales bacterium]|nr:hypothetical protein [Gemmatales bacterium]
MIQSMEILQLPILALHEPGTPGAARAGTREQPRPGTQGEAG